MQILAGGIASDVVTSAAGLVVSTGVYGSSGEGDGVGSGLVRSTRSGSVGRAGVATETGVAEGAVLVARVGGAVSVLGVEGEVLISFVVRTFSDVVGMEVDAVTVDRVGTGTVAVAVVLVTLGTSVVMWTRSVVLAVVTRLVDVTMVVDGTPDTVVVPGLGVMVGGPGVVDLVVAVGGLVTMVTFAVLGLTVGLSVVVILGVTLVVTGALEVVLSVVVLVVLVVAVGVALAVDTTRVVTLSGKVVGLGAAVEVVGRGGDQEGGAGVVALVDTSTLLVTGGVVRVTGCRVTGRSIVVVTSGGVLVGAVVRGVSGAAVTGLLVVTSEVKISGRAIVLVVAVVVAAEVAVVVPTGCVATGM